MKSKNIVITLLLLFAFSLQMYSQNSVVKGRVFDEVNNEPLPFVNVIVKGTSIGSTTDLDGNFIITGLEPGFIQLQVSFIGYKTQLSPEIQVSNAKEAWVEIPMQQTEQQIEEVIVSTSPFEKTEESPVSLTNIGLSDIESNPGSNRDIAKVIQSFPGVGSAVSFRNDILIRGGGPAENSYYLDGVEIPNINHFATQGASGGAVGIINADFLSSVDYYSGAFPANRSGALSGIFEFSQVDGNKEKLRFRGTVGASELSLTADGPLGERSSFVLSARQSYLQFLFDFLELPFLPNFNDFQLKSRTRIDDKNELTIVGLGSIDRFELNTGIENPDAEQQYILSYIPVNEQWSYALGAVYKHFRENSYQTLVVSRNMLNNESYKYPENDESKERILDYQSQEMENKIRFENTQRFNGFKLIYGVNGEYARYTNSTFQKIFIQNQLTEIDYDSNLDLFKWGLFTQISKKIINNKLTLSLGARTDANNYSQSMQNMFEQFAPRFSASYQLTDFFSLNMNTGRYFQLPPYTTLGYRNSEGKLINKENELKYIAVNHYIAGGEFTIRKNSILSIEGFYKQYGNYPFSLRDSISLANKGADYGTFGDEPVNSTSRGRAVGFEIMERTKIKDFNLIVSYTFVRSEFESPQGDYIPTSWDSKHILTLTSTKNLKNNWTVGLKWRYLGGLPYTPYDLETSAYKVAWDTRGRAFLDYSRLNEKRLNPFHQLDMRVDKKFFFDKWSLMTYIDIQNLYNYKADQPDYIVRKRDENGKPVIQNPAAPVEQQKYVLERIETSSGTVLPTIGIMIEF